MKRPHIAKFVCRCRPDLHKPKVVSVKLYDVHAYLFPHHFLHTVFILYLLRWPFLVMYMYGLDLTLVFR